MFSKFQNPALITKLPMALRVLKTARACTRWGVRENVFCFTNGLRTSNSNSWNARIWYNLKKVLNHCTLCSIRQPYNSNKNTITSQSRNTSPHSTITPHTTSNTELTATTPYATNCPYTLRYTQDAGIHQSSFLYTENQFTFKVHKGMMRWKLFLSHAICW